MRVSSMLVFSLLIWAVTPAIAAPAMVWSQQDGQSINVYFSSGEIELKALTTRGVNIAPNLFKGMDSSWVTWVDKSRRNANTLNYIQLSEQGKVLRSGRIPGVQGDLYAPAIAMDSQARRVWLVWVEFNGNRENLYASYLDLGKRSSGEWAQPLQITPDDAYSANLPVISRAEYSSVTVEWMRSSANSSELASAVIPASIWQAQRAMQGVPAESVSPTRYEALSVRQLRSDDRLVKSIVPGQRLTADEAEWQRRVAGKNVQMGAVHSGVGASSRLVDTAQ